MAPTDAAHRPDQQDAARSLTLPRGYAVFLRDLKERIRKAQIQAALAANREMLALYWHIGKSIVERQQVQGWGAAVIDRLGRDLQAAFPGIAGFSRPNIYRMRSFYLAHAASPEVVSQPARQSDGGPPEPMASLPWFHNVVLIEKVKEPNERIWYAWKTLEHGWSRAVLDHHIDTGLCLCQGGAQLTNFHRTLPPPHSDLAQEVLKDPYHFDFVTLAEDARERELERGLLEHIRDFLIELGVGFAFVGSQVPIEVGGRVYYLDLLFYHLKLRSYVVIDIKRIPFEPEFAGKMNFYLSAVNEQLRHPDDRPSIGLILCKAGNQVVAEYALRDIAKPVGVSNYVTKLTETLPKELRTSLPTVADLEAELNAMESPERVVAPPKKRRRRP